MEINNLQRQLGLRLKEIRLAKGLKQEDLENYEFSYRYYGKIERGLVNPTFETLIRLCEIFEVRLPDLFAFMDDRKYMTEDGEAIAVMVSKLLKGEDQEKIRKLRLFLDEIL
jgi:transcriptional regulator with XRE-family HTH domain